jgi:hypothetical protein
MKKLRVFDFDDTLALTDSAVRVFRGNDFVRNLSSHEFKTYELKAGERYNLDAFDKIINPRVIKPTMGVLRKVLGKPSPAMILTGRGRAEPVREWLASIGVKVQEIVALGKTVKNTSDLAAAKRKWIADAIKRDGWEFVEVFEDSKQNLAAMESLKSEFPDVKFVLRWVGHYAEKMKEGRQLLRFGSWLLEA